MNRSIEMCLKPKYGLHMFDTYQQLHRWLEDNKKDILGAGGTINLIQHKITFTNGAQLWLGHNPEQFDKWRGCRFTFIHGTGKDEYQALVEA